MKSISRLDEWSLIYLEHGIDGETKLPFNKHWLPLTTTISPTCYYKIREYKSVAWTRLIDMLMDSDSYSSSFQFSTVSPLHFDNVVSDIKTLSDLALIFCIYGKMLRKWAVICLETKKYERQNRISFRSEIVGLLWFFNVNSFWAWFIQIYRCVCLGRLFCGS